VEFTPKEKEVIREVYFRTSLTEPQIEECFRGLSTVHTSALMTKQSLVVPLFGNFRSRVNKKTVTADKVHLDVSLFSTPSETFKRIASQVEEEKDTNSVSVTDSFKWFIDKMTKALGRNISHHGY